MTESMTQDDWYLAKGFLNERGGTALVGIHALLDLAFHATDAIREIAEASILEVVHGASRVDQQIIHAMLLVDQEKLMCMHEHEQTWWMVRYAP